MRIAIVTESFPPAVNGVANSVVRVADHLVARGHQPLVIAPAPSSAERRGTGVHPYPVVRIASVPLPRYRSFRLGVPSARLTDALIWHGPDMLHLASPFLSALAPPRSPGNIACRRWLSIKLRCPPTCATTADWAGARPPPGNGFARSTMAPTAHLLRRPPRPQT